MKIFYFGNNLVGCKILRYLVEQDEEIIGLAVHPHDRSKYRNEIIQISGLDESFIFDGSRLSEPDIMESISKLRPEIGISVFFGYIISSNLLDIFPLGCINVHPSFLPYNRGAYPNVWSILEGTPAGATIHYVNSGIDTGDIIAQEEVPVEPIDTGKTLYHKLEYACVKIFMDAWPIIRAGNACCIPQSDNKSTYHRSKDVEKIDEIDLNRTYMARELIDTIRARTFSPYPGAYFLSGKRKVYMRLQLFFEDDLTNESGCQNDKN